MKVLLSAMTAALLTSSMTASAEGGMRLGVDYLMLSSDIEPASFDTSAIQGRFFNQIAPNVGVEVTVALGVGDDTYNDTDPFLLGDFSVTTKLANMIGVFARAESDPASGFQVFGRVGLARVDVDVDIDTQNFGSGSESYDDTGLAFGVGVSYSFDQNIGIVAEFAKWPDVDFEGVDVDTDVLSIGLQFPI